MKHEVPPLKWGGGGNSTPEFKKFAHSNSNLNASYQTINPSLAKHLLSHFSPKNSHYKHFIIANMIDYAGGIGSLARILQDYYGIALPVFEKYMNECIVDGKVCYVDERHLEKYDAVFNSAMFEHITKREHLEHINSLVKDDGILIIHTVVRQNIPKNPQWFYVIPVHCAFHTNDSMQILMQQWGYTQSLYSPIAKSWVLFKKDNKNCINGSLKDFATKINKELEMKYFYHKDGFVDYWVD